MNAIVCTLIKVTIQYMYQVKEERDSTSPWTFENFDDAVAFCEKQVEKYRNDPEWRVNFYTVEEQQFRRCDGENPGQLYIGIPKRTSKFIEDFHYDEECQPA